MNLQEKLSEDLKTALRAKDEVKVSTLRFLMAAIHNIQIEKGKLSEEDIISVIQKQIKQRKESIEGFQKGGREELVEKETQEMEVLAKYLPEQMSDTDIEIIVEEAVKTTSSNSLQDMGKVMGLVSGQLKGKADMSTVSKIVKEKLSS